MSKIYNFLPVKVVSYMMLPCTLPVESAIAMVQRWAFYVAFALSSRVVGWRWREPT